MALRAATAAAVAKSLRMPMTGPPSLSHATVRLVGEPLQTDSPWGGLILPGGVKSVADSDGCDLSGDRLRQRSLFGRVAPRQGLQSRGVGVAADAVEGDDADHRHP